MAYSSLYSFIEALDQAGELIRVKEFVSPHLEITEITDRFSKHQGKALLFENTGTSFPLLINSMGSERRMCLALGVSSLDDLGKDIMDLAGGMLSPRESFVSKLALLPTLAGLASWMPRRIRGRGKCQEVIMEQPDLSKLPVLTCWPFDGGPFITLPIVHTCHPVSGRRNVGMYRMQVLGDVETGMHWHLHKNSASHYREYKQLGMRMPVAVALGGDPAYTYSATAPLPENMDEYLLAGFLRKKRVDLVKCLSCDIEVPADADIIIEGYVDPAEELVLEGPFGDHTGFYSLADMYPRFHVTCITHRRNAVYPATIVGIPPQEDAWIGKATERIFLAPIRLSMLPEIEDMVMPSEGVFHNIVIVKIRKTYPGQAAKVMNSLWGAGQMMFNKILVILDRDIDLNDLPAVVRVITETADPVHDILFSKGPMDVLDHSSSRFAMGSKLGIDATDKWTAEVLTAGSVPVNEIADFFRKDHPGYSADHSLLDKGIPVLLLAVDKNRKNQVRDLHRELYTKGVFGGLKWVFYIDRAAANLGFSDIAWLIANNIDPLRDCFYASEGQGETCGPIAIDGSMKSRELDYFEREWPNIILMSDEVITEIDRRWEKLGLGPFIPSPSIRYRSLVTQDGAVATD